MRRFLAPAALAAAGLLSSDAAASAAVPRPLERIVEDADVVVVANGRTKPAHPGDPFVVDVEETLKGAPPKGPLTAKASCFFTGCVPPPAGTPPPASIEGRATRVVLFLDAGRQARDTIVVERDERVSAWIGDRRPAAQAAETIRALVALDAETDVARAVELWTEGLAHGPPLLVGCLLHRVTVGASAADDPEASLGPRVGPLARRGFAAGRERLLAHVARLAASPDVGLKRAALQAASRGLHAKTIPPGAELDAVLRAAREASSDADVGVRDYAARALCAARDPALPDRLLAAMRKRPVDLDGSRGVGACGRTLLFASYPDREEEFLAAAVAYLDDPATEPIGVGTLNMLTGRVLGPAETWRAWWKERRAK